MQALLAGRIRGLRLIAQPAGLILRGISHSYYAKQLAQHAVMDACEWPIAANEIEVRNQPTCGPAVRNLGKESFVFRDRCQSYEDFRPVEDVQVVDLLREF
jgi:hypothetical protein